MISVILPCYKAAGTLRRAVDSLLDGAPADPAALEVLLVEDGSPDETGELCDQLAAADPRVRALHRSNGGAGSARNTGLDAARGEWVMFGDADDLLLPGLWSALEQPGALDRGAGMVLFGLTRTSGPVPCPLAPGFYPDLPALGGALDPLLFESGYLAAPYSKLLRKTDLRFDESLRVNEDILFNLHFLQKNSAIFCLKGVYYKQDDGLMGSLSRRLRGDLLDAEQKTRPALEALLRHSGIDPAPYLRKSRVRAALNQYGLLTGCKGKMPFARRRALFARILSDPDARAALLEQLRQDPHPLLALPYRFGAAFRLPGWLAAYTMLKPAL